MVPVIMTHRVYSNFIVILFVSSLFRPTSNLAEFITEFTQYAL